jgi:hypothetical protein
MSYVTKLIGNIEPGIKDDAGKFSLPSIEITRPQIIDPRTLRDEFGTLGRGLEHIIANPLINRRILEGNVSEFLVDANQVQGLGGLAEEERAVVQAVLTAQHNRSKMTYRLASNEEMADYDGITKGVFKGTLLGGILGGVLTGAEYAFGVTGVAGTTRDHIGEWFNKSTGIATEILARAGPGLAEVAGISHEVLEKDKTEESSEERHIGQLALESVKEFPGDSLNIARMGVCKGLWYQAINVGGYLDKARGRESRVRREVSTEEWAEGGETGPARGIILLTGVRALRESLPFEDYFVLARIGLNVADAFATTYISVGNNLQAGYAVLGKCVEEARAAGSPTPWRDGLNEFLSDPLQLSNMGVVAGFNAIKIGLLTLGFRPELIGPIGASLENTVMSWDTGIMAQLSKPVSTALVVMPAKISVNPYNLMNRALEYDAANLQSELMVYSGGRRAFSNYRKMAGL